MHSIDIKAISIFLVLPILPLFVFSVTLHIEVQFVFVMMIRHLLIIYHSAGLFPCFFSLSRLVS